MSQIETISFPTDLQGFSEVIDVRSPDEFALDHVPGAINLPVLDNQQRHEVGLLYKSSPFEARRLGAALVAKNAATHLSNYLADKPAKYAPLVYCWRGGMRSHSLAHILKSIGWQAKLIEGGYQNFRRFIIRDLERITLNPDLQLYTLAGLTGVGKTRLLHALKTQGAQVLDLEGIANHKGSLLGANERAPQPAQKLFESSLWQQIRHFDTSKPVWTEAESNKIGQLHCPPPLWLKLNSSKVIDVTLSIKDRITILKQEYPHFSDDPQQLKNLLDRLRKLRGHKIVDAWQHLIDQNQWSKFVEAILTEHYDPSYRPSGHQDSNYQSAEFTLAIEDASNTSYELAAKKLMQTIPKAN